MRKSHEKVCRAFLARRAAHAGNVTTDGKVMRLFGVGVARWYIPVDGDGNILIEEVEVTWAGHITMTTAAVLNAIAECHGSPWRFGREKGVPLAFTSKSTTRLKMDPNEWWTL